MTAEKRTPRKRQPRKHRPAQTQPSEPAADDQPELTLADLANLKDEALDIGPVRGSGNPAPLVRTQE